MRSGELILELKRSSLQNAEQDKSINFALGKFMGVLHANSEDCNLETGSF